jgi:hypothetical protein
MRRQPSSLYARYNGFTLGSFLAVARLPFAAPQYAFLRRRVAEFAVEAGLDLRLPRWHASFSASADAILERATTLARARSNELGDFVTLGAAASLWAINAPALTRDQTAALHARWWPALERYGVRPSGYKEWTALLPRPNVKVRANLIAMPVNTQVALTAASALLAFALEAVEAEMDTCYVAMPFRGRFRDRFATYYAPALRRAGYRPIRAWGGLTSEEHYMSLITIISRSGAILAEVTGANHNVIHEIGITHGLGKPAYLVAERSVKLVPSNLGHLPVIAYDPRERDWPRTAITKAARFIRWMSRDYWRRIKLYDVKVGVRANKLLRDHPRLPPSRG